MSLTSEKTATQIIQPVNCCFEKAVIPSLKGVQNMQNNHSVGKLFMAYMCMVCKHCQETPMNCGPTDQAE